MAVGADGLFMSNYFYDISPRRHPPAYRLGEELPRPCPGKGVAGPRRMSLQQEPTTER